MNHDHIHILKIKRLRNKI